MKYILSLCTHYILRSGDKSYQSFAKERAQGKEKNPPKSLKLEATQTELQQIKQQQEEAKTILKRTFKDTNKNHNSKTIYIKRCNKGTPHLKNSIMKETLINSYVKLPLQFS